MKNKLEDHLTGHVILTGNVIRMGNVISNQPAAKAARLGSSKLYSHAEPWQPVLQAADRFQQLLAEAAIHSTSQDIRRPQIFQQCGVDAP